MTRPDLESESDALRRDLAEVGTTVLAFLVVPALLLALTCYLLYH